MSFNSVILVGNLGKDPELRYTATGTPVTQFTMATNDRIKKEGEWQKHTTWFRVTVFGRQAETCSQYLTKGRQVFVQGRLRLEEWADRDGKNRCTLEVVGDKVQFLGSKDDRGEAEQFKHDRSAANASTEGGSGNQEITDDDIPF